MKKEYSNSARRLTVNELSHQVAFLIINKDNYTEATKLMIENDISIEELSQNTMKLTSTHFAKLTDFILEAS